MPYTPWKTIAKLKHTTPIKGAHISLQILADMFGNGFLITAVLSFLLGKREHDEIDYLTYTALFLTMIAAIPMALTMSDHWVNPTNKDHDIDDDENNHKSSACRTLRHVCHEVRECATNGLTSGIIDGLGAEYFLRHIPGCPKWFKYTASSALGLISTWGNFKLNGDFAHAEKGLKQLLAEIPKNKLCPAVYHPLIIFISHFFQGSLPGYLLLKSIHINNRVAEIIVSGLFGLLVMCSEGRTEAHAVLSHILEDEQNQQRQPWLLKIFIMFSSLMHSMSPVTGMLQMIRFIYEQTTNQELAEHLPVAGRICIFLLILLTISPSNIYGVYATTKNETIKVLKSAWPSRLSCCFWPHRDPEHARLLEENLGTSSTRYDPIA